MRLVSDRMLRTFAPSLVLCLLLASPLRAQDDARPNAAAAMNEGAKAYNAGMFARAIDCFQRAADLYERAQDKKDAAIALENAGITYRKLGDVKQAVDAFQRAITLTGDTKSRLFADLNTDLGSIAAQLGQFDAAVKCLGLAIPIYETAGDRSGLSGALDTLGETYARMRKFDEALRLEVRALDLIRQGGDARDIARVLNNIGATAKGKGDPKLAIQYLEESLKLKRRFAGREQLAGSLTNLALLYFDVGQNDKSAAAFAEAIDIHEEVSREIREASRVGEYQDWFRSSLYRRYAHVLIGQKKPDEALAVLERGRAQGLARQTAQNRADFGKVLSAADSARLKEVMSEFHVASDLLARVEGLEWFADGPVSPAQQQILDIHHRYREAERRLSELRQELAARSPAYRQLSGANPPTISELKALAAKNPDTLYLQWAIGAENTSLLFALSAKNGVEAFVIELSESDLEKRVNEWRDSIQKVAREIEEGRARAIYQSLFSAIDKAGLLAPGKFSRLVLVGDGPLLDAPFAALIGPDDKRLVERMPISVSSSFGVLTWSENHEKPASPVLIVADPLDEEGDGLPQARIEGLGLVSVFPGSSLVLGWQGSRNRLLPNLGKFGVLHFATHGQLDVENGLRSGLVLAPERRDEDPSLLSAQDIVSLRLNAQLAVLSACETGQGQKSGGEGLLGLTWAFRAAGCPATAASLWKVEDEATRVLMEAFYKSLKAGKRKDEALRDAMIFVKSRQSAPTLWAAFQLNGDTSPLKL